MLLSFSSSLGPALTLSWCFSSCFIEAIEAFQPVTPSTPCPSSLSISMYLHVSTLLLSSFRVRRSHPSLNLLSGSQPHLFPQGCCSISSPHSLLDLQTLSSEGPSILAYKKKSQSIPVSNVFFTDKLGERVAIACSPHDSFCRFTPQSNQWVGECKDVHDIQEGAWCKEKYEAWKFSVLVLAWPLCVLGKSFLSLSLRQSAWAYSVNYKISIQTPMCVKAFINFKRLFKYSSLIIFSNIIDVLARIWFFQVISLFSRKEHLWEVSDTEVGQPKGYFGQVVIILVQPHLVSHSPLT